MAKPLKPVHVWACPYDFRSVTGEDRPEPCVEHDCPLIDMGWRVGEAEANYAWYSSLENALRDRRC
jgi:hypothetical protein